MNTLFIKGGFAYGLNKKTIILMKKALLNNYEPDNEEIPKGMLMMELDHNEGLPPVEEAVRGWTCGFRRLLLTSSKSGSIAGFI